MTNKTKITILFLLSFIFILLSFNVVSASVAVANSHEWSDVYSVLLSESINDQKAFFLNSDSITALTKVMAKDQQVLVYESKNPYIKNLYKQLTSVGYDASLEMSSDNLNLDLDPQLGNYYVISKDNPRISISLASLAVKEKAWVLIVDENNIDAVVQRLNGATSVVGVGNFKRAILEKLTPIFTQTINNNDIFKDSQDLAKKYGVNKNLILADGAFLETEFFMSKNPVMLSGHNKILDDTFAFLEENNVKSVVIVGNELAVVGEQIRTKSNKQISVFVKFGQSDTSNSGKVYALTMFPLPKPRLALTVSSSIYDAKTKQLIASFENLGNAGVYELTTLSIKDLAGTEIGTASNAESIYLAAGEKLPIKFYVELPLDKINGSNVEFYTSFGLYPSELDSFLTMKNSNGPPFSIPLSLAEITDDNSNIDVLDVTYYKNLKRVAVKVQNKGENTVYYNLKINGLTVNGLDQDFFKADSVSSLSEKTTYLPVELDEIDLEENSEFNMVLTFGADKELLLKNLNLKYPFIAKSSGLISKLSTDSPLLLVVIIIVLLGAIIFVLTKVLGSKKGNSRSKSQSKPSRTTKQSNKRSTVAKKSSRKKSTVKRKR